MTTAIAMPEEPQPIRSTAINHIRIADDPPRNKVSVSVTSFPIVLSPLLSFEPVYRRRSVYDLNFGTMPDTEMMTMMVNGPLPIQFDLTNIAIQNTTIPNLTMTTAASALVSPIPSVPFELILTHGSVYDLQFGTNPDPEMMIMMLEKVPSTQSAGINNNDA
uniref:Uncharacterized protein n=1 Tax=Chaetoceros debilis TaxID=122233 RepID=A0A7S3QAI8_9STRA